VQRPHENAMEREDAVKTWATSEHNTEAATRSKQVSEVRLRAGLEQAAPWTKRHARPVTALDQEEGQQHLRAVARLRNGRAISIYRAAIARAGHVGGSRGFLTPRGLAVNSLTPRAPDLPPSPVTPLPVSPTLCALGPWPALATAVCALCVHFFAQLCVHLLSTGADVCTCICSRSTAVRAYLVLGTAVLYRMPVGPCVFHCSCGNTAIKGSSWPSSWANLASFSLSAMGRQVQARAQSIQLDKFGRYREATGLQRYVHCVYTFLLSCVYICSAPVQMCVHAFAHAVQLYERTYVQLYCTGCQLAHVYSTVPVGIQR
jgi:hypothetical protein